MATGKGSVEASEIPPVYSELKDLHLDTELVKAGTSNVTIVAPGNGVYDAQASRIQEAIETCSGVRVPIAQDDSPAAAVPSPLTTSLKPTVKRSTRPSGDDAVPRTLAH